MKRAFTVRRCHEPGIVHALQEKFADTMPAFEFRTRLWWVAWHEGKPVGYAAMKLYDTYAWSTVCGVLKPYRGNGLQKRLVTARLAHARKQGVTTFYTYTMNHNHPSNCSLVHRGFVPCDPPYKHYGKWAGTRDVIYWRRDL